MSVLLSDLHLHIQVGLGCVTKLILKLLTNNDLWQSTGDGPR